MHAYMDIFQITETKVSQIELENATQSFKKLYQERQNLLESWEKTIETMKKCDNDIKELQAKEENYKVYYIIFIFYYIFYIMF